MLVLCLGLGLLTSCASFGHFKAGADTQAKEIVLTCDGLSGDAGATQLVEKEFTDLVLAALSGSDNGWVGMLEKIVAEEGGKFACVAPKLLALWQAEQGGATLEVPLVYAPHRTHMVRLQAFLQAKHITIR
jgi:hypothetical protein